MSKNEIKPNLFLLQKGGYVRYCVTQYACENFDLMAKKVKDRFCPVDMRIGGMTYELDPHEFDKFAENFRPEYFKNRKFYEESKRYPEFYGISCRPKIKYLNITELILATYETISEQRKYISDEKIQIGGLHKSESFLIEVEGFDAFSAMVKALRLKNFVSQKVSSKR